MSIMHNFYVPLGDISDVLVPPFDQITCFKTNHNHSFIVFRQK